jgi:ribosomal protein L13E
MWARKPLSSKPGKKSEEAPTEALSRPSSRVPEALVSSRRGTEMVTRRGRGFSLGELSGAGLAPRLATGWGVRIDVRRRSVLGGNVESLKTWGGLQAPAKKAEGKVRKLEEELVKVEKKVKKEGTEVKAGTVKVERGVKKEASKAEKAIKAKTQRPKTKRKKKASS